MFLSRREVLKGMGATVALPFLDAMAPDFAPLALRRGRLSSHQLRLICIEQVHGAAGSSTYGAQQNLWAPAMTGREFDLSPTSLKPLEAFRDHITIVSNCDVPSADPTEAREIGGDHFRSSAAYLTQTYPKRTDGADVECGISMDQLYAQRFGQDTPIPSMQLCIENVDQSGGCGYGYSCVYTDTISWASPTKPLPMIRDPRVVFDQMFGVLGSGSAQERRERRQEDLSILDWVRESSKRLERRLGAADRVRLDRLPGQRSRDRAPAAGRREAQRQRRAARAADGAARHSRLVRRTRQADVRLADAGLSIGRHARVLVQARARRLESRLQGERLDRRVPHRVAPRRKPRARARAGEDQRVSRRHAAVSAAAAQRNSGRRRLDAG